MAPPSALALQIARTRVDTYTDRETGEVTITVCNGSGPAWQVGYPRSAEQANLVANHVEREVDTVARFIDMGLEADERDTRLQELRGLARTVVDGLRFQVPQHEKCAHEMCLAVRRLRALVGVEGSVPSAARRMGLGGGIGTRGGEG